jgi:molybdate transport system regulatory protein
MQRTNHGGCSLRPRFRVVNGTAIAFGPGKADLLEALQKTGSITEAASRLKMSYMRAWTLIRTMNRCFYEPLVISVRGGTHGGGGARLTAMGSKVLALYRRMEVKGLKTVQPDWQKLQKLLKSKSGAGK